MSTSFVLSAGVLPEDDGGGAAGLSVRVELAGALRGHEGGLLVRRLDAGHALLLRRGRRGLAGRHCAAGRRALQLDALHVRDALFFPIHTQVNKQTINKNIVMLLDRPSSSALLQCPLH